MRVLVLAPVGRDAALLAQTVEETGLDATAVVSADQLLHAMTEGVGAIIMADEAVSTAHLHRMTQWLGAQPAWSDPPFIILMPTGRPSDYASHRAQEFSSLGNFTLIDRPVRPETIVSAVRSALRARMKQYEVRSRQESLARANADLEHFAHSASHDLKEPLRNISIFSDLVLTQYAPRLDERGAGFLGLIRDSSKRMDQLLADLLAYAQASSIPEELPEPIPAAKALEVALGNLAGSVREIDARITVGDLPVVKMREVHVSQLFQNLIGNAVKYRKEGVTPEVRVQAKHERDRWVFSIADNGIGISHEYRESIFGIFKRLHTNGHYAGTGMGLAICQRIVERYGGRIWVESEPGQGSTFLFTIPE